jgi:hypothetical protein
MRRRPSLPDAVRAWRAERRRSLARDERDLDLEEAIFIAELTAEGLDHESAREQWNRYAANRRERLVRERDGAAGFVLSLWWLGGRRRGWGMAVEMEIDAARRPRAGALRPPGRRHRARPRERRDGHGRARTTRAGPDDDPPGSRTPASAGGRR